MDSLGYDGALLTCAASRQVAQRPAEMRRRMSAFDYLPRESTLVAVLGRIGIRLRREGISEQENRETHRRSEPCGVSA
jgi:hypothetical protein